MKLKATLRLAHLNLRREKAGEGDGDIGTDLKLTGQLHLEDLRGLFGASDDHAYALLDGLYDGEGNMRSLAFKDFALSAKGTGVEVRLKTEIAGVEVKFREAEVDQFVLAPQQGRQIELTFRVKANPSDMQVASLAEMLKTDLDVTLTKKQGELQFGPAPEETEEEEEQIDLEGASA